MKIIDINLHKLRLLLVTSKTCLSGIQKWQHYHQMSFFLSFPSLDGKQQGHCVKTYHFNPTYCSAYPFSLHITSKQLYSK